MNHLKPLPFIVSALFLLPAMAGAVIEQPSEIPSYLSHRFDLVRERFALFQLWDALEIKIAGQNEECSEVPEDSPKIKSCREDQAVILSEIETYKNRLKRYEEMLAEAIASWRPAPPAPKPEKDFLQRKPVDLAKDPEAARLSEVRLRQVENEITWLRKAIDLLSYTKNPYWANQWEALTSEMRETDSQSFWLGMDLMTAGIAGKIKLLRGRGVPLTETAVKLPVWQEVAKMRMELEGLVSTMKEPEAAVGRKVIETLRHLEKAPKVGDLAEALGTVNEACAKIKDNYEEVKKAVDDPKLLNLFYRGGTVVGNTAAAFVKESIKNAPPVAVADTGSKLIEAGLLVQRSFEQDRELRTLSSQSYDRHQKQLELNQKISALEEERARLQIAAERAR